jgi:small GTP-binding protein
MGVDIRVKRLEINDTKITLQIWDFVGENRFRIMFPSYARGSSGGIYMYDISQKTSLMNIDEWLNIFNSANPQTPVIMVGGKLDLQENRAVSIDEAMNISKSHDFYDYIECSSKTGENVEIIFDKLFHKIIENIDLT